MVKKNKRHKPLYKKFLRLKINPWANNTFLKVKMRLKIERHDKEKTLLKKPRIKKESFQMDRFKKEKWVSFLEFLKKTNKFYRKFKPYKLYSYGTCKFASQGNSFKKRFRNELIAKKIFNYQYGVLSRKYTKDRIIKIYNSEKGRNPIRITIEFFESRLDSILYRSKFSHSVRSARQLIAHKHVKINNKTEQNKSYVVKQGDLIEINSKSISVVKANLNKQFKERPDSILWPMAPSYLNINYNTLQIVFGDIKNFDFSMLSTFKNHTDLVISSYYRH